MSIALPVTLRSAADLTPDILTALLRRHDPNVTITGATLRRTWQGTTSHLHLAVDYADADTRLPRHLFVKTQLSTVHDLPEAFDVSLSEGGGGTILLDDETRFYRAPDLRRTHERELLDNYRGRLRDTAVATLPDREDMWTAYRRSPAWGFCMWAITPDQMYSVEIVEAVLGRFAEAYTDLDTGALLRS
jgi:hypothetical protein